MSGWNRLPGRGNAGGTIGLRTRGQLVDAVARVEHVFDFLADKVFPPVDAVRVDRVQRAHAVAGASGDLAGCSSGVQPQRQDGIPQVVMCSSPP